MSRNNRTFLILSTGLVAGALAGWLYWRYVGCLSGSCPIWSHPLRSSAYASLLGMLFAWNFVGPRSRNKK